MSETVKRSPEIVTCVVCSKNFERRNRKRKYCSDACRVKAYRDTHPEEKYQAKGRITTVELQDDIRSLSDAVKELKQEVIELREENVNLENRLRGVNWSEILLTSTGSSIGSAFVNYFQKGKIAESVRDELLVIFKEMLNEVEIYSLQERHEIQAVQSWILTALQTVFENQARIGQSLEVSTMVLPSLSQVIADSNRASTQYFDRLTYLQDLQKNSLGDRALLGSNPSTSDARRIDDTRKT